MLTGAVRMETETQVEDGVAREGESQSILLTGRWGSAGGVSVELSD